MTFYRLQFAIGSIGCAASVAGASLMLQPYRVVAIFQAVFLFLFALRAIAMEARGHES